MNARSKTNTNPNAKGSSGAPRDVEIVVESGTTPLARMSSMGASSGIGLSAPAPLTMPFAPGDVIAEKYQIIGLIGAGGVAFVVAALHLELGEMVALKFLRPESLVHEEVVARFATEARSAARIKSEHVCRVYDVGALPDGVPFIVMEYLEGKDLCDVLREKTKLPVKVAVDYVMQACEALACAHAAGIVHRDVKPENLFLTQQAANLNVVKVLDFGISKSALTAATQGKRRFAKTMMPMGTPAYMSPEQIRACSNVDARTDIWALGCVLFELVTGACAFDAPTLMQLGAAILERDAIPLRKLLHEAPAGLEAVITKCLAKDPDKRYQNIAELAADLYPYGPRRARISAERCSQILQSAGPGALFELSSVGPPPPTVAVAIAAMPPAGALPRISNAPASDVPSTGTPGAISVLDASAMRPGRRWLPAIAFGLVAAGAGAFGLRLLTTSPADTAKTNVPPAAVAPAGQTLPTGAQAATAAPRSPEADATAHTAPSAEASASSKTRTQRSRVYSPPAAAPVRRDAVIPRGKPGGARSAAAEDEPDVGY